MVLRLTMADAKTLRNILTSLSALVDEVCITADEEGLKVKAMDPSHVAMVDFEWSRSAFDEFEVDKPMTIGLNIEESLKLLRRASDETLELIFDESVGKLEMRLSGRYRRRLIVPTLQLTSEEIPPLKIEFDVMAKITSSCLSRTVADAATVSDILRFKATTDNLTMEASGELGEITVELDRTSEALLELQVKQPSSASYSLTFLEDIVKSASNLAGTVGLEFSTDKPLKLNFEILQGKLVYYVAPYVE
ncbi:MAG: proliferating cell nuclear antigen (pcna) [Candidatus Bathyarchaeia archaeon]